MPNNFGKMTSDEASQELKDFCFPKKRTVNQLTPPYTVGIHVKRLKEMLKLEYPGDHCPAARGYDSYRYSGTDWDESTYPCDVCTSFLGLGKNSFKCPCILLGQDTAIALTIKAIEEYERKNP